MRFASGFLPEHHVLYRPLLYVQVKPVSSRRKLMCRYTDLAEARDGNNKFDVIHGIGSTGWEV